MISTGGDSKPAVATYFLYCRQANRVKIGRAKDVDKRVYDLACASPFPCVLVGIIDRDCEHELHKRFRSYRRHREWFNVTAEVAGFICQIDPKPLIQRMRSRVKPLSHGVPLLRIIDRDERAAAFDRREAEIEQHNFERQKVEKQVARVRSARTLIRKIANRRSGAVPFSLADVASASIGGGR